MAAEPKPAIYAITNIVTGKKYIGGATYVSQRFYEHKNQLRNGKHNNKSLQEDWVKYGEDSFSFEILEFVHASHISEVEDSYIKSVTNKYNILSGNVGRKEFGVKETTRRAANKRNQDKRKAEMTAAAKFHGFANWSAMITAIIRREWPL